MAEQGVVIGCHTIDEYKKHMQQAPNRLIVIDFTASWCELCRLFAPVFAEFSVKYEHVVFLKVDVNELEAVSKEWEIEAMPSFIFVKNGNKVDKVVGAKKEEVEKRIMMHGLINF